MPLPEHEQRQLQEIERALFRDDPKFARLMRADDPQVHHERKLMQALPEAVIGISLLTAGAVAHRVHLDAVGVVIVLLSLVRAVVSWRRYVARVRPARSRPGQTRRARMTERMEERWRRRQEGSGGMPGRTRS